MNNILTGTQFQFNCSERGAYTAQISNIKLDGINHHFIAPDYVDAFIMDAKVDGRKATDQELDQMNDDGQFVFEQLEAYIY